MKLTEPRTPADFEKYFELRWRILRQPWGQARGSEQDAEEKISYHIMAIENNRALGVARLQFPTPTTAQLRYMAVDTIIQGKGLGRQIVEHMENYARKQSATELFLHARENATAFYKKLGYRHIEDSYLLFGTIQHYKMSKQL